MINFLSPRNKYQVASADRKTTKTTRFGLFVPSLAPLLVLLLTAIFLFFMLFAPHVAAQQPGNVTYFANWSPVNDIFELQANPGDDLVQGRSYDFTKIYGTSGALAHWNDYWEQGQDCSPDYVNNVSYILTNGAVNPKNVYLDPTLWPTGDWINWDGCFEQYYSGNQTATMVPYIQGESVMFTVLNYSADASIIHNNEQSQAQLYGTPR